MEGVLIPLRAPAHAPIPTAGPALRDVTGRRFLHGRPRVWRAARAEARKPQPLNIRRPAAGGTARGDGSKVMSTTEKKSSSQTAERDRALAEYLQRPKPSLRWTPEERKRWRERDREFHSSPFEPRSRDDADLRFYFAQGKTNPLSWLTPEQQKTWRRVDRCLDGRGYHLMLHYTKPKLDAADAAALRVFREYAGMYRDPRAAAGFLDAQRDLVARGRKLAEADATDHQALRSDYRAYVVNTTKTHAQAAWEPYVVLDGARLRLLLRPHSAAFLTMPSRDGSLHQVFDPTMLNPSAGRHTWGEGPSAKGEAYEATELSTWGDRRANAGASRLLLEFGCGMSVLEVRRLSDAAALQKIAEEVGKIAPVLPAASSETPALPSRDELQELNEQARSGIREFHARERAPEAAYEGLVSELLPDVAGQALAAPFWDERRTERNVGRETTTVTELAERTGLKDTKWVRAALRRFGYPGAPSSLASRAQLSLAWFRQERGQDFWEAVRREKLARDAQRAALSSPRFSRRGAR